MLYKFKSKNAADVIMLEPNGRQVLQLIGKQTGATGIIQPSEMAAAITALETAIQKEEAALQAAKAQAQSTGDSGDSGDATVPEAVSLRQRAAPFIDLLRRNAQGNTEIVWGV